MSTPSITPTPGITQTAMPSVTSTFNTPMNAPINAPTNTPSNMKMWIIVGVMVVVCCASVAIGLWFWLRESPSKPVVKCDPGDKSKFEYTRRVESGSDWVCPPGYTDTGCTWDDGDLGEFQCRRPRTKKCSPGDQKKSQYTRRVQSGSNWVCPSGFADTGCGWNDGEKLGELQCRKTK